MLQFAVVDIYVYRRYVVPTVLSLWLFMQLFCVMQMLN